MIKLVWISIVLGFLAGNADASTFIGNGGSILDTELRSTLLRLKEALKATSEDEKPCECAGETSQCAILRDLNDKQQDFCQDFIEDMQPALLKIIDDPQLKIRWVTKLSGKDRSFDAAASASSKTVLIDEKRFANFLIADRVQLLAHELLHLLPYQGKALVDDGPRGPFDGNDGGRRLLDTAGAAYAIIGMRAKAIPISPGTLSRPFKNIYLDLGGGIRSLSKDFRSKALTSRTGETSLFDISWFPRYTDNLGYSLGSYSEERNSEGNGYKSKYTINGMTLGLVGRWIPLNTNQTYLDSIQVIARGRLGYASVEHTINDNFVSLKGNASTPIVAADVGLQFPLFWNFWVVVSQSLVYTPYEVSSLKIESKSIDPTTYLGLSYGFTL